MYIYVNVNVNKIYIYVFFKNEDFSELGSF